MAWLQLHFETAPEAHEALETALFAAGAVSVSLTDAGDSPLLEPGPGEQPLWPGLHLSGLFEATDTETLLVRIAAAHQTPLPSWRAERFDDRDWVRAWLDDYQPLAFGSLEILPHGFEPTPGKTTVHLDPGLAFGTGTHPTTALCLDWLAQQSLQSLRVLDYGCGSGILAVAALKLGATEACGVDHDPQALLASRDNARRNGIADERLRLYLPADAPAETADVVLANILAGPLVQLAPQLSRALAAGGCLVLSGLLEDQAEAVMAAYRPALQFEPPRLREGWVCLVARAATPD